MRPKAVIVGAGLGGCVLAHALLNSHDVTIIERGEASTNGSFSVIDSDRPALTDPHFGSGLGGSTRLWHNGLIEIDEQIFDTHWPISKVELARYYELAFSLLSDVPIERVRNAADELRRRYRTQGVPDLAPVGLFYPRTPVNVWESLKLEGKVNLIRGEVIGFVVGASGSISGASVTVDGQTMEVTGNLFVLAGGGLSSPILLQKLSSQLPLPGLKQAGRHYEDHPMGFVGEVEVTVPLYRLWNYHVKDTGGNLRLPMVIRKAGLDVSFQLRPAANYYRDSRRERVGSVLNELRRNPASPVKLLKLLSHWDDVLDILSFKFGIRLPTKHYTLLMVAQMPTSDEMSVWSQAENAHGDEVTIRRWHLTEAYVDDLSEAIAELLHHLEPIVKKAKIFPEWFDAIRSSAHHSGTARMSSSAKTGVCDIHCKVHGIPNLYVCDGSVIPASGIANTGLTIAALALRLSAHLQEIAVDESTRSARFSHSLLSIQH